MSSRLEHPKPNPQTIRLTPAHSPPHTPPHQPPVASKHSLLDLRLYLETPWPDPSAPLKKPARNEMLLFFKYYDPKAETLAYVGHLYAPKAARMKDLFPVLRWACSLWGWAWGLWGCCAVRCARAQTHARTYARVCTLTHNYTHATI